MYEIYQELNQKMSEYQSNPSHLTCDLIILFIYDGYILNFGIFPILLIVLFLFFSLFELITDKMKKKKYYLKHYLKH